jgi:putative redox protein
MEMIIDFPGEKRVDAHFGAFAVQTDQPPSATAPTPFEIFLSSIGTCAGIYVLGFCRKRQLPTEGLRIVQRVEREPQGGMVGRIALEIQLPPRFAEKHRDAVIQSAQLCAVKKHMEHPPVFEISTTLNCRPPIP